MGPTIRLWQRDRNVVNESRRSPMLTRQIATLQGFPSAKKAAERLHLLFRAGLLKRVPYFHPARQGKPEFAHFTGTIPHARTLSHTIATAEVRVLLARWLPTSQYEADFYYASEIAVSGGIIPDATIILRKGDKSALFFVEVDNGTEPVTSAAGYSLAKKLGQYAAYFDGEYERDFAWVGPLRGFRVCLIVPPGRVRYVQHLVAQEEYDFVLTSTFDLLNGGFGGLVWQTHERKTVNLLGRGDVIGDLTGELVRHPLPTETRTNSCTINELPNTACPENPTVTNSGHKNEETGDAGQP
jgi:Replication-relaxation